MKHLIRNLSGKPLLANMLLSVMTLLSVVLLLTLYHRALAKPLASSNPDISSTNAIFPYQGLLTDSQGNPLNGNINIVFRIYESSEGGTPLWEESHTGENAVPVENGEFHVLLGGIQPIPASVWTHAPLYLGIQVEDDEEMTPRQPIGSVMWSMRTVESQKAHSLINSNGENVVTTSGTNVGIGVDSPQAPLEVAGMVKAEGFFSDQVVFTPTTLDYTYEYQLPKPGLFQISITAKGAGNGCGSTDSGAWSIAHRVYFASRLGGYPETVTNTYVKNLYSYNRDNSCTTTISLTGKHDGKVDIRVQNGKNKPVTVTILLLDVTPP